MGSGVVCERSSYRNVACPEGNAQLRREYRRGSYGGKEGQITWRTENNSRGYWGPSVPSQN